MVCTFELRCRSCTGRHRTLAPSRRRGREFYTPHSVVQLDDGKLALIDDGSSRPGCTFASGYAGCWSRAAIYELDEDAMTATLVWQFEDPRTLNFLTAKDATAANATATANATNTTTDDEFAQVTYFETEVETRDLFNWDGGSVNRLEDGRILVAFTSPYDVRPTDMRYSMEVGSGWGGAAFRLASSVCAAHLCVHDHQKWQAWEVDKDGNEILSITVPHGTDQLTKQGAYRFIPWKAVNGETTAAPFAGGVAGGIA